MYKLERIVRPTKTWYEVMLSPFKTKSEIKEYYIKYSKMYSPEDRIYKITNLKTGKTQIIK
jgi:hypothetical protein